MKSDFISKNKGNRNLWVLVSVIFLLLSTAFMAKPGYCRGWWGKQNLFFRSLWLCSCSSELEHTFYPDHVEVMFSACQDVSIMPTWDGHFFISGDENYNGDQSYILSGYSGEKSAYTPPKDARVPPRFYTHQFVYISYPVLRDRSPELHHIDGWYIVLEQLPDPLPPPFLSDGGINPEMVAFFAESSKIFLHPSHSNPFIVAIDHDTENDSQYGFVLSRARFPDLETDWVEQFLQESNLPYIRIVPTDRYVSPNGRFLAENDGIYDVATGQQVATIPFVDKEPFSTPFSNNYRPCCWFPDSSTVIYRFEPPVGGSFYEVTLIEWLDRIAFGAPIHMDTFSLPVLKVHVPEGH